MDYVITEGILRCHLMNLYCRGEEIVALQRFQTANHLKQSFGYFLALVKS